MRREFAEADADGSGEIDAQEAVRGLGSPPLCAAPRHPRVALRARRRKREEEEEDEEGVVVGNGADGHSSARVGSESGDR